MFRQSWHYAGTYWNHAGTEAKTPVIRVKAEDSARGPSSRRRGGFVQVLVGETTVVVLAIGDCMTAFADHGLFVDPAGGGTVRADGAYRVTLTGKSDDGRALDGGPTRPRQAFTWLRHRGEGRFSVDR